MCMLKPLFFLSFFALLFGCSSDSNIEEPIGMQTCKMVFAGTLQRFDSETRTTTVSFHSGDVMYLKLGNTITTATYNGYDWIVTIPEDFPDGSSGNCVAYFIENGNNTGANVSLTFSSIVYTGTGSYSNTKDALVVNATVSPVTSRIRFRGISGTQITVSGLQVLSSFDAHTFATQSSSAPIDLTVKSDGFTPYVYSTLSSDRKLSITYNMECYTSTLPSTAMQIGHSGFLDIPSSANHSGWNYEELPNVDVSVDDYGDDENWNDGQQKSFTANGISFTMIAVEGGTFTMGATAEQGNDAYSDEKPAHQVTLSSYYIGMFEVTQELWQAVMGSNPSFFKGNKKPVEQVSWNDCQEFITKLNSLTGQEFRLPTEAEWEYAARGGKKSKGYKYSGSNNIDDVAWYNDNSSSTTHDVGQKIPNELGLYDMSGNVCEWCSDWYGSYSSNAQTNPVGPSSGSFRVYRGGCWCHDAGGCRSSLRRDFTPGRSSNYLGFRLALSE